VARHFCTIWRLNRQESFIVKDACLDKEVRSKFWKSSDHPDVDWIRLGGRVQLFSANDLL